MLPDQFVWICVRRVGRKMEEFQAASKTRNKLLCLLGDVRRPTINDQKDLILSPDHETLEKLDEYIGVGATFFLDHEAHVAPCGDRRDEAHAVTGSSASDDRGLTLLAPGSTGVMVRAHVRGIPEVNLGFFSLRKGLDPRIFLLQPLLHQRFVSLQGTVQWLLAGDAQVRQKSPNRRGAQSNIEFAFNDHGDHLARPQRVFKLHLPWALRHHAVNPFQLIPIELWWTPKKRFSFQRSPSATAILSQPAVNAGAIYAQSTSNRLWALAVLNALYGTLTHRLKRRVIKLPGIVLPHRLNESYSPRCVKLCLVTYAHINMYQWRMVMGANVLTAEKEKEMALKPKAEFKECMEGCPRLVVVPAGTFM